MDYRSPPGFLLFDSPLEEVCFEPLTLFPALKNAVTLFFPH